MNNIVVPSEDVAANGQSDDLERAARELMEAIKAEPVPDRLHELALVLGQALEKQKRQTE